MTLCRHRERAKRAWRSVLLTDCFVATLLAMTAIAVESRSLTQQAEEAWLSRDKPGQTEKAIGLWDQALKAEPGRTDLLVNLTKACGRAVRHASSSSDRKRWADEARDYGKKAVALNPQSSDAYAAYGEALGQWADAHKGIHSLKTVRRAVEELEHAITLNPKNAYAHMLLASFYREAPGVISVGDKEKALAHAKLAVECGPGAAINHLVLGRVYLDFGRKEEAIKELQTIVTLTPPLDAVPETLADQESAQKLLQDLGVPQNSIPCGQSGGYCSEQEHP